MLGLETGGRIGISIVITTYNNGEYLPDLLDSLVNQEPPLEIIIVDSESTDETASVVRNYSRRYRFIKFIRKKCSRGEGRNIGVRAAKYDYILFTDGDAIANAFWVKDVRIRFYSGSTVVAGKTVQMGYAPFEKLSRVELFFENYDVTFPSVNLGYKKSVFLDIGGFDSHFITAEDIDLNIRAVLAGNRIDYCDSCIIYHRARSTFVSFIQQAFWNGFGRKQLTMKHRDVWSHFRGSQLLATENINFWYIVRGIAAFTGYLACKIFGDEFSKMPHKVKHTLREEPTSDEIQGSEKPNF